MFTIRSRNDKQIEYAYIKEKKMNKKYFSFLTIQTKTLFE